MGGFDMGMGIFGAITNAMAPYQSHRDAMLRQHDAQGYDTQMFSNRYRLMVGDLKRAGLNPMLAYMNGPGSAPSSPIGQGANFDTDPIGKGMAAYNQSRIATAQEQNINQQTEKIRAETLAQNLENQYKDRMLSAQLLMNTNSAENIKQNTFKINQEIDNLKTQLVNIQQDTNLKKSHVDYNNALQDTQQQLQRLYYIQAVLTGNQNAGQILDNMIKDPKARVSLDVLGTQAARGDAMKKLSGGFWSMFNPFMK